MLFRSSDGKEVVSESGAYQDQDGVWRAESLNTVSALQVILAPYVDVRLVSSTGAEINEATLRSLAIAGATLTRLGQNASQNRQFDLLQDDAHAFKRSMLALGGGNVRIFFDPADADGFVAGSYVLTLGLTASWTDSAGKASEQGQTLAFSIVDPVADLAAPFSGSRPAVDVHVANMGITRAYVDVIFTPTAGTSIDYASIMDAGPEFSVGSGSVLTFTSGVPTPLLTVIDANGVPSVIEFVNSPTNNRWTTTDWNGDGIVDAKDRDLDGNGTGDELTDLLPVLTKEGVTRFRYAANESAFVPGEVVIDFKACSAQDGAGWRDTGGNGSVTSRQVFQDRKSTRLNSSH